MSSPKTIKPHGEKRRIFDAVFLKSSSRSASQSLSRSPLSKQTPKSEDAAASKTPTSEDGDLKEVSDEGNILISSENPLLVEEAALKASKEMESTQVHAKEQGLSTSNEQVYGHKLPVACSKMTLWHMSVVVNYLLGSIGTLFAFKLLLDPGLSDFLSPGPGQALFGDSGRLLMYELGSYGHPPQEKGLQGKVIGAPAWFVGGLFLLTGSIGVFSAGFRSPKAQLITVFLCPIEAAYCFLTALYLWLSSAPWNYVFGTLFLGTSMLAVSIFRVFLFSSPQAQRKFAAFLGILTFCLVLCSALIFRRMTLLSDEVETAVKIRTHFASHGKKWTSGVTLPDGFEVPIEENNKKNPVLAATNSLVSWLNKRASRKSLP